MEKSFMILFNSALPFCTTEHTRTIPVDTRLYVEHTSKG